MASNTTLAAYFLAAEVKDASAGLLAAAFIGIVPGKFDVCLFVCLFGFYVYEKNHFAVFVFVCPMMYNFFSLLDDFVDGRTFVLILSDGLFFAFL